MSRGHSDMHSIFSEEKLLLCDNNNVSEDPEENKVHEVAHKDLESCYYIFITVFNYVLPTVQHCYDGLPPVTCLCVPSLRLHTETQHNYFLSALFHSVCV